MLRATRRRIGASAWLALGLVVGLPTLVEAQLFPNRPIKRQRENCAAEPPFNAHVRRDYFGYYPTCWSKFPEGWACPCPNPELPDKAASYRAHKPDPLPDTAPPAPGTGPDDGDRAMPDTAPPAEEGAPPLPDPGRQPFRMDGRTNPPARDTNPPTPVPPDPSVPPRASLSSPTSPDRPATSVGLLEMPSLPSTSASQVTQTNLEPGSMSLAPEVAQASTAPPANRDLGPLPAASPFNPSVASEAEPIIGQAAPAQAPQRRGILGGLFNSGNKRRR